MADPFSIFAGALTVAQVSIDVGRYLRSISKTAKHIDEEIESLEREVNTFYHVFTSLEQLCATSAAQQKQASGQPRGLHDPSNTLWARAADLVQEGHDLVERLRQLLEAILGPEPSPRYQKIEDVRKAIKLLSKDQEYGKLRKRLVDLNLELNTMLTAIDLTSNALFRFSTHRSLEELPGKLSQKLQGLGLQLKAQIERLETKDSNLEPSVSSAKAAVTFTSLNEHFYVQKPDTSIWTGRKKYLDLLRDAMLDSKLVTERIQKRFVVHGVPGAGKTQFCCKFAQDYRESFWGIFWVDASSAQNAAESWKKIAKIAGRDPNEEAGRHWLSNLHSPWLLVIDSADNSEDSIGTQFPSGERGCILITTRNPRLIINATVGHLSLDRLEENEANDLLRKATKHEPWDRAAKSSASSIAKHLGYLPLALIHAGRAIYHRLCTLHTYIPFFNDALNKIYSTRPSLVPTEDQELGMGAFTSFDIIYSGLEAQSYRETLHARVSKDAIELVNIFAFLHNNDICLEILIKASQNLETPTLDNQTAASSQQPVTSSIPLLKRFKDWTSTLILKLMLPTPVFPHILRTVKTQKFDEPRARRAIDLLVQMSLITESSETGSYSMHPLVHVWVRKRLSTSAQALWCEATANVLATSIKLPPLIDKQGDQDFYLRILPHVNQVQSAKKDIDMQLQWNRQNGSGLRSYFWISTPSFTATDAMNSARYSRVYMECAKFKEAEKLQRLVESFLIAKVGRENPILVQVQLALAMSLWHMDRSPEAQEMQEEALRISRKTKGDEHTETLKIMDALGETYWQRGWLKEAKALHQSAIDGLQDRPEMVRDRFKAITHLGRVHEWYCEFDKAKELYEESTNGLTAVFGAEDLDTMIAVDHLAMALLWNENLAETQRAYGLIKQVYETRQEKLGKEHFYTLWAACNYARVLAARGSLENDEELFKEAKDIFHDGLEIVKRNMGEHHMGMLVGRTHLAHTFALQKDYETAEKEYKDIMERQRHLPGAREGTHRDRIGTMQLLEWCYESQGRLEEGLQVYEQMMQELDALGGQKHPWRLRLTEKHAELLARIRVA